jgi:transcriptional antiterminator RfaH
VKALEIEPGLCWYAIYTKKQKEHYADLKLLQLEIETFLPLIYCRVRRQNQLRPLFPCYLFARFDARRWLYTINHLEGVNKVVCFNERPIPVDSAIIDSLKERIAGRGYLVEEKSLSPGDPVRIQGGLFEGLEGRIEAIRPRDRVVILLSTILSRARVEIDRDLVEVLREYTP